MTRKSSLLALANLTAITLLAFSAPTTGHASVGVNIDINAYLPAPPGVQIHVEAGRPYYVENHRRVYVKKKPHGDRGKHKGHYKHEDDGHKKGHGKKHGRD